MFFIWIRMENFRIMDLYNISYGSASLINHKTHQKRSGKSKTFYKEVSLSSTPAWTSHKFTAYFILRTQLEDDLAPLSFIHRS